MMSSPVYQPVTLHQASIETFSLGGLVFSSELFQKYHLINYTTLTFFSVNVSVVNVLAQAPSVPACCLTYLLVPTQE